jgi:hypothetical protein
MCCHETRSTNVWLLTRIGAMSVVQAGPDPGSHPSEPRKLMVRARVRRHLELLQRDHASLRHYPIIESDPKRDYRWRMIVPRETLAKVMAAMVASIDYSNFKSACAASPDLDPAYDAALHEVWATLRRLQR